MDETQALIEKMGEHLRAKILSKFQTSAFLAGLAVAVLGVQLTSLEDKMKPPLFWLSIALMFGALLVYIAALIKLDELTMPKRFWPEGAPSPVPAYQNVLLTDEELVELQKRMVFHWFTLTLTATGTTGVALVLLLVPTDWVAASLQFRENGTFIAVVAALGLGLLYLVVLSRISDFKKLELHD